MYEEDYDMDYPPNEDYQEYRRSSIGLIDTTQDLYLMQIDISPYTKNGLNEKTN